MNQAASAPGSSKWLRVTKLVLLVVMAAFYVIGGINHFRSPEFYLPMMPPYLPLHAAAVLWSGVAEVLLGIGVLIPRARKISAWGIFAMLVAFLPVHVHMLANPDLFPDVPLLFLWLRFPIQGVLMLWAWWYTK